MRKVWEALALLVVVVIAANIIIASVTPYLPVLGLIVILVIGIALFRLVILRR